MKTKMSFSIAALALVTLACNLLFNVPGTTQETIPTETFSIDGAVPVGIVVTEAIFLMAPGTTTVLLAGGARSPAEGEIQYNVAEWKPALTTNGSALSIEQRSPDDKLVINPKGAVNRWDVQLGEGLMNVRVECPAGDFTMDLADSLPDGTSITIQMGAGNLRLLVPVGAAANVTVNGGPKNIETEGNWIADRRTYRTDGTGATWAIDIEMGVGNLTLVSR